MSLKLKSYSCIQEFKTNIQSLFKIKQIKKHDNKKYNNRENGFELREADLKQSTYLLGKRNKAHVVCRRVIFKFYEKGLYWF